MGRNWCERTSQLEFPPPSYIVFQNINLHHLFNSMPSRQRELVCRAYIPSGRHPQIHSTNGLVCVLSLYDWHENCDVVNLFVSFPVPPFPTRLYVRTPCWCAFLIILSCALSLGVLAVYGIPKEKYRVPSITQRGKLRRSSPDAGIFVLPVVGSRTCAL